MLNTFINIISLINLYNDLSNPISINSARLIKEFVKQTFITHSLTIKNNPNQYTETCNKAETFYRINEPITIQLCLTSNNMTTIKFFDKTGYKFDQYSYIN
jgi:hypothetical protein